MTQIRAFLMVIGLLMLATAPALAQTTELREAMRQVKVLYNEGRYDEAIPIAEKTIALGEQEFGADHPTTAILVDNLGIIYSDMGRHAEAEERHWQAVAIMQQTIAKSPHTISQANGDAAVYRARALYNRARIAQQKEEYTEAIRLYEIVGSIFEIHLGMRHEDVAMVLTHRADALRAAGRTGEADEIAARAAAIGK